MALPDRDPGMRALAREWLAARIVVIGGLVIGAAVAGYFVHRAHEQTVAAQRAAMPKKVDAKALARAELAVCTAELIASKSLGIVPNYAELASPRLVRANAPRRFICEARTHLTQYFIAADILCDQLADSRCVSVYRIASHDGTLLYARAQ